MDSKMRVLLMLLSTISAEAGAVDRWIGVVESDDGKSKFEINRNSMHEDGTSRSFEVKISTKTTAPLGVFGLSFYNSSISKWEANCTQYNASILGINYYSDTASTQKIGERSGPMEIPRMEDGSVYSYLLDYACKKGGV